LHALSNTLTTIFCFKQERGKKEEKKKEKKEELLRLKGQVKLETERLCAFERE